MACRLLALGHGELRWRCWGLGSSPLGYRVHAVSMDIDPSMPRPHLLAPYHLLFALIRSAMPMHIQGPGVHDVCKRGVDWRCDKIKGIQNATSFKFILKVQIH